MSLTNTWVPIPSEPPREMKEKCFVCDVVAKRWNPRTDKFEFKRFVDCHWGWSERTWLDCHGDELEGYRPTHFMLVSLPSEADG